MLSQSNKSEFEVQKYWRVHLRLFHYRLPCRSDKKHDKRVYRYSALWNIPSFKTTVSICFCKYPKVDSVGETFQHHPGDVFSPS